MNELWIRQYSGYSREDLFEYLSLLTGDAYRIYLPKTKALYYDDPVEIMDEFLCMSLMGEKFYALGSSFLYSIPRLDRYDDFTFELCAADKAGLAGVLADALALYDPESEGFDGLYAEVYELLANYHNSCQACYEYYVIAAHLW